MGRGEAGEVERHEAQRQRLGVVGAERLVDDWAVVGLADDESVRLRAPLDGDLLLDHLQGPRPSLELIGVAVDPLDEQVHDVGHHVGERPGKVVVLAHEHAGQPRKRRPAAKAILVIETHLVGDSRHARRQVRVARQKRPASRRTGPRDGPVVRSAGLDREANRVPNAADLLGQAEAIARPRLLGVRITGLPRGYPGSSRAASSAPSSRAISARRSSRSQLVERPKERSLARVSESAGTKASKPIRRSWSSAGSGRSVAAAFTPAQNASSADRSSGCIASASRSAARRRPRVLMNRSVCRPWRPAISASRPVPILR